MDPELLGNASSWVHAFNGGVVDAFIVVRGGYLVAEHYWGESSEPRHSRFARFFFGSAIYSWPQ